MDGGGDLNLGGVVRPERCLGVLNHVIQGHQRLASSFLEQPAIRSPLLRLDFGSRIAFLLKEGGSH